MKKEDFRKLTGVTPVTELPLGRQPLAVRHPSEEMVAVRPVLVVTDDPSSASVRAHADAALRGGQTVIRQGELWWHDFLWFVKTIEKFGMRPWMWSDYVWEHHDEFLKRCPRSVLQSNWYYDEGFDERAFRWPRIKCYLDLDRAGFDQVPTASNHLYDTNMAGTVAFAEKNLSKDRLKGYLMSTWRRCLAEQRGRNLSAADQIGAEKRKLGE